MADLDAARRGIDIDDVIENAKTHVEVKHILRQFVNVNGDSNRCASAGIT